MTNPNYIIAFTGILLLLVAFWLGIVAAAYAIGKAVV